MDKKQIANNGNKRIKTVNAIEYGLHRILNKKNLNLMIKQAVYKVCSEPKYTKQEILYNTRKAKLMFNKKTIMEAIKGGQ